MSNDEGVCQGLTFSYGVHPVLIKDEPENWSGFARQWLHEHNLTGPVAMLVAGPSPGNPDSNYRLEFIRVNGGK
jgi:pyruvate kinase